MSFFRNYFAFYIHTTQFMCVCLCKTITFVSFLEEVGLLQVGVFQMTLERKRRRNGEVEEERVEERKRKEREDKD